ncbi:MAG: RPB7/RPC8 family DNA-directed RNA polymerase subunit [Promethearchaeota archaeon]
MFFLVTIRDTIRIMPRAFGSSIKKEALEIIKREYEDVVLKDLGYVITVIDILEIGRGKIIPIEE